MTIQDPMSDCLPGCFVNCNLPRNLAAIFLHFSDIIPFFLFGWYLFGVIHHAVKSRTVHWTSGCRRWCHARMAARHHGKRCGRQYSRWWSRSHTSWSQRQLCKLSFSLCQLNILYYSQHFKWDLVYVAAVASQNSPTVFGEKPCLSWSWRYDFSCKWSYARSGNKKPYWKW